MSPVEKDPSAGLNGMVAAVLRAERAAQAHARRMTQDDVAEQSGVPIASLRRYLNGQRHIDTAVLDAICDAMGLDPSWVIAQAKARMALSEVADTSYDAVAAHEEEGSIAGEQEESDTP